MTFQFEGDAQDCEGVAVDPTSGTILLASKTWQPFCDIYALPLPTASDDSLQTARSIAKLNLAAITGMDISPDGRRAMLVTYANAYEFRRAADETWAEAFARVPREIGMPTRKQGESICYGSDGVTLYLTSETRPCPLFCLSPSRDGQPNQPVEPTARITPPNRQAGP